MDTAESRLSIEGTDDQQRLFRAFLDYARRGSWDGLQERRLEFWSLPPGDMTADQAAYVDTIFSNRLQGVKPATPAVARKPESYVGSRPITPASLKRRRRLSRENWTSLVDGEDLTNGELAVLAVIMEELMTKGFCDMAMGRIAAIAGVSRRWGQHSLRLFESLKLLLVEIRPWRRRQHHTNRITLHPARADQQQRLETRKRWWRGRGTGNNQGRILLRTTRDREINSIGLSPDTSVVGRPAAAGGLSGGRAAGSVPPRPMRFAPG